MNATATDQPPLRGDEAELYRLHHSNLIGSVFRAVSGDRAHVEDACQYAWAQLLRYQPDRDRVFGWLRTTAIREVYDSTARERREFDYHPEYEPSDCAEDAALIEARRALRTLASLPVYERRYLALTAAGFTAREIADVCDVTQTHVRRYLDRGRRRVRIRRQ